jgi:hypothetical protein
MQVGEPGEAHGDARTRLGVFEVDRLTEGADDSGAQSCARLGVASGSSLIPDRDGQGRVPDPALDLEVDAGGVVHRVCRRFSDRKRHIGEKVTLYPRCQAPVAYLRSRLWDACGLAREPEVQIGRLCSCLLGIPHRS